MAHLSPIRISLNSFPILFLSMILLDEIPNLLLKYRGVEIFFFSKNKKKKYSLQKILDNAWYSLLSE